MIRLDRVLQLANLSNLLTLIKGYVDRQLSTLASSLQDIFGDIDIAIDGKGNCGVLLFENVSVPESAWTSDNTYVSHPFKAAVSCSGVTAGHSADVTFDLADATSGTYAPVCQTATDTVFLWAASKPNAAITVQIECRKAVES